MADTGLKLETRDGRSGWPTAASSARASTSWSRFPTAPTTDSMRASPRLTAAFETAYREKFALTPPDVPVEFINIRVASARPWRANRSAAWPSRARPAPAAARSRACGRRTSPERRGFEEATVYDRGSFPRRDDPRPGGGGRPGSTLVIGPGGTAEVMPSGSIIIAILA